MKIYQLVGFLLLCGSVFAAPASITVEASAVTKVQPDKIELSLRIRTVQANLKDSLARVRQSSERLHQAMKAAGIDEKALAISDIEQSRAYTWNNSTQVFIGYSVSISATLTVKDRKHLRHLTSEILDDEVIVIAGMTPISEHEGEIRLKSLADATLAAQRKAEVLAKTLGVSVGKPLEITETSYEQNARPMYQVQMSNSMQSRGGGAPESEDQIVEIPVRASVKVVFELK